MDTDLFYPTSDKDDTTTAKAICSGCPVREECLEDALARRDDHGVLGGHTAEERRAILKRRRWGLA